MLKKIILCFIIGLLFSKFSFAEASILINEVGLYPTDGRFLELYNDSGSAVDLTDWYIQRKTATGSSFGSLVSKTNLEGKTINAHGYFVISKEAFSGSDVVLGTLTLTESNTIQIKNSAGDVVDKVGWGDSSDCQSSCPSNPEDGKSIQRISDGSWIISTPTPGTENSSGAEVNTPNVDSEENGSDSPSSDSNTTPTVINPTIKVKILAPTIAFAGQPAKMQAKITGHYGEDIVLGKLDWSFGDGTFFEQVDGVSEFSHPYFYPGEYVLYLEYYPNFASLSPEVVSKAVIKVIPTTVTISKVGSSSDVFVELSNNSSSDIDVSGWSLSAHGKLFVFPKNTVIMSKKFITISGKFSGFTADDRKDMRLFSSTGELVSSYSSSNYSVKTPTTSVSAVKRSAGIGSESNFIPISEITPGNISANVGESSKSSGPDNMVWSMVGLFVLLASSGGAVYFVRRQKSLSNPGDDFEILDE